MSMETTRLRIGVALVALLAAMALLGCSTQEVSQEEVPYDVVEQSDDSMWLGDRTIATPGQAGLLEVTWRVTGKGENASRERVSEAVLRDKVDEVVKVGTRNPRGGSFKWNGATISATDVSIADSFPGGSQGWYLRVGLHVDNTDGERQIRFPPGAALLGWNGVWKRQGGWYWTGEDVMGIADKQVTPLIGESAECALYFGLSPGSVKPNPQITSDTPFTLVLMGAPNYENRHLFLEDYDQTVHVDLKKLWLKPLDL